LQVVEIAKRDNQNPDLPVCEGQWQRLEDEVYAGIIQPFTVLELHFQDKQGKRYKNNT
jgi:hypothetical protein